MARRPGLIVAVLVVSAVPLGAQDWSKESKERTKRAALHDGMQRVRGDSGKWNDQPRLQQAPPIERKPAKVPLDTWADQLSKKKTQLSANDDTWLIFQSEQLDDNDRVWVERIERRGQKLTVVANRAKWQGKYFRNFTYYQVIALNLGKLAPGKYEATWLVQR